MTHMVPRTCTVLVQPSGEKAQYSFEDLRPNSAYVLLGDPGAGKTETFKAEAAACGGFFISVRDFLSLSLPANARGKTLFIDGLDESRAGEGDGRTPLDRLRQRLDELGRPRFRLSCREADWLGASDRHALTAVAPNGEIVVYHLDPLTDEQIREILANDPWVTDPDTFLKHAQDRGLAGLLQNPQTLRLLVEAVTENQWPSTRQDTYRMACEKLAAELNIEHQSAEAGQTPDVDAILSAAGALCALQLLADISGFATLGQTKAGFVALRDIPCFKDLLLARAIKTRLFVGAGDGRFTPAHRSVAEYLAARFLATVLDNGLPLGRLLSLMTAADGGTVAGLRGLHAWLAVHHVPSRCRLIEIDPLAAILYGDPRLFSVDEKSALLTSLHRLARQYTGFRWQDWSAKPFGALATPDMVKQLKSVLSSPSRDEGDQAFLDCVLDAVRYGEPLPALKDELRAAVMDATRWPTIRSDALTAYLHVARTERAELRQLAEDIRDGRIADPDDEMLGRLLHEAFPSAIAAKDLLTYFHRRKDEHLIGSYHMFWSRKVAEVASDEDVAVLLDELAAHKPSIFDNHLDLTARALIGSLLPRGITVHGHEISDERLYQWLGIALDKHGFSRIEREEALTIKQWLEEHPDRYIGAVAASLVACAKSSNFRWCVHRGGPRFQNAEAPPNTALWWLDQADHEQDQERAEFYFFEAIGLFFRGQGCAGLSLEFLEEWVAERSRFDSAYKKAMYDEIPDWRREHAEMDRKHEEEDRKRKDEWMQYFRKNLPQVRTGQAHPAVLHDLARGYLGLLIEAQGDTPLERISTFLDDNQELIQAALEGFKRSLERRDLPSVEQIFASDVKGRTFLIRTPCIAGMEELQRESADPARRLKDDVLAKLIAFHFTFPGNDREWFKEAVRHRPSVVADVLVHHLRAVTKGKKDHMAGAYALAHDDEFAAVARIAIEPLLGIFPERAREKQVSGILDDLLKAALRYLDDKHLKRIIQKKLSLPNLDHTQRVYWLAAGLVVAPNDFEAALTSFIGKSRARVSHLAAFFSDRFDRWIVREGMRESSLAYLICMFAPLCSPERPRGAHWVSPAMHTADFVRALVDRLGGTPTVAADIEIKKLLADKTLSAWHSTLRHAEHTQRVSFREATFRHPNLTEACQTLENGAPANAADLAALTADHLRELALELRHGNTDQYKQFWNVDKHARPTKPRPEDNCRDTLLERLRDRLRRLGIDAQPEGHYADDKRADVRVSYTTASTAVAIPVEIKRDSHQDLWKAMADQLTDLYTRDPQSKGRGIFVVFWFGGDKRTPAPPSGKRPTTAVELEAQLIALRQREKQELISVRVIDCSRK